MEEGTGLSLYILVGSILFGLFAVMAATFGTDIQAQTSNIVACVQSYVLNEPSDCGESESDDLPVQSVNIRIGPKPEEWAKLTHNEQREFMDEYLNILKQESPGVEDTYFYDRVDYNSRGPSIGAMYGIFNESGTLIKTYIIGQTNDSHYQVEQKTVRVNDVRLVPKYVLKEIYKDAYDESDGYYGRDMYSINLNGNRETYIVYRN